MSDARGALELDAHLSVGTFALDATVSVAAGETVALVGRNGAGKSTLLAAVAGLTAIDTGSVTLDGVVLDDSDATFVPPERRAIGLVAQQISLFPHLSVLDNVAFGLRTTGMGRSAARESAREALDSAGLGALAARAPSAISGGQAARVALVRALVRRPALVLLDEPLAAIDAELRPELRASLRRSLDAFDGSALLVTHDIRDAEMLAGSVVVLDAGRVLQRGTLADLRRAPADPVVTRLLSRADD